MEININFNNEIHQCKIYRTHLYSHTMYYGFFKTLRILNGTSPEFKWLVINASTCSHIANLMFLCILGNVMIALTFEV